MRLKILTRHILLSQIEFRILKFKPFSFNSANILIRKRYSLSLIAKALILMNLVGNTTIIKKRSNFLFFNAQSLYKFKPQFVKFNKNFILSLTKSNLIDLVKLNGLENIYDFYNLNIRFNFLTTMSRSTFISESIR